MTVVVAQEPVVGVAFGVARVLPGDDDRARYRDAAAGVGATVPDSLAVARREPAVGVAFRSARELSGNRGRAHHGDAAAVIRAVLPAQDVLAVGVA